MKKIGGSILIVTLILVLTLSTVVAAPPGTWTTDVTIFNMDSVNPATVLLTRQAAFTGSNVDTGSAITLPNNIIPAGGSLYYNPVTDATFPSSFDGSMVISSNAPVAAIVSVANTFTGSAYASDTYGGISKTATKVILPVIMARLGTWNTRISIQNAGTVNANISVSYIGTNAPATQTINNLPAGQVARLDQYDAGATNFNGSAIVTSTNGQPLAITVEEYRTSGGVLITYTGIADSDAANTVFMPGYIDQGVWSTDFNIVNPDTVAANVTITFTNSSATITGTIPAGSSGYFNRSITQKYPAGFSGTFPTNYYGSATITTTGGKVVLQYNISNNINGGPGNANIGYVGVPTTASSLKVVVPLIENLYSSGWTTTYTVQNVEGGTANLKLYYAGNKAPLCSPCNVIMTTGSKTFTQNLDGHLPTGFIGGVRIESDKKIVVIGDQGNFISPAVKSGDNAGGYAGYAVP